MKKTILLSIALAFTVCATHAQQADDATSFMLDNGKVLHFATPEAKAKFLAARNRTVATATLTPAPTTRPVVAASTGMGHTALDERPAGSGTVNTGAPAFTADFYLLAPETWNDKQLSLSVAYLEPANVGPRDDGVVQFTAYTWGRSPGTAEQNPGGSIVILATPKAAKRIASLCGNTLQFVTNGVKMSYVKGTMTVLKTTETGRKEYGVYVTE